MKSGMPQLGPFVYTYFLLTQWHPSAGLGSSCLHWMGAVFSRAAEPCIEWKAQGCQHSFLWRCWLKSKGQEQASSSMCWFPWYCGSRSHYHIQAPAPCRSSFGFSFSPWTQSVSMTGCNFNIGGSLECVVLHRSCMEQVIETIANFL